MKNIFKIVACGAGAAICGAAILSMTACDNVRTKAFGGTMTVEIEKDQKLVNCSWKGGTTSLWILTRTRKEGEQPETYKYSEKSFLGVLEGTVTIVEK